MLSSTNHSLSMKEKAAIYALGVLNAISSAFCLLSLILVNSPKNINETAVQLSAKLQFLAAMDLTFWVIALENIICGLTGLAFVFFAVMIFLKKTFIFYVLRVISAAGLILTNVLYIVDSNIFYGSGLDGEVVVGMIFGIFIYDGVEFILSHKSIHALCGNI